MEEEFIPETFDDKFKAERSKLLLGPCQECGGRNGYTLGGAIFCASCDTLDTTRLRQHTTDGQVGILDELHYVASGLPRDLETKVYHKLASDALGRGLLRCQYIHDYVPTSHVVRPKYRKPTKKQAAAARRKARRD